MLAKGKYIEVGCVTVCGRFKHNCRKHESWADCILYNCSKSMVQESLIIVIYKSTFYSRYSTNFNTNWRNVHVIIRINLSVYILYENYIY